MSASNVGDVTSLTDGVSTQSAGGNTQVVSLSGGVSTMSSSGATTCYKKKTCEEGGYYSSVPTDQKCSSKSYNGYTCYTSCSYKTCSDYGYKSSIPSGQTCTPVEPRDGLTCYKDCKDNIYWPTNFTATISISVFGSNSWRISVSGGFNESGFEMLSSPIVLQYDIPAPNTYFGQIYNGSLQANGAYSADGTPQKIADYGSSFTLHDSQGNTSVQIELKHKETGIKEVRTINLIGEITSSGNDGAHRR